MSFPNSATAASASASICSTSRKSVVPCQRLAARGPDLLCDRFYLVCSPCSHDNCSARLSEADSNALANTPPGAGNHRHLPIEAKTIEDAHISLVPVGPPLTANVWPVTHSAAGEQK